MIFKILGVLAGALILYLALLAAFTSGQADVRGNTVVEFGSPFYTGVFHGTCQTELYFNGQRGNACATDGRRDKNGYYK
jgi:hypothetical protein